MDIHTTEKCELSKWINKTQRISMDKVLKNDTRGKGKKLKKDTYGLLLFL